MEAIHGFAREGDMANLLKCIENGVSVNLKGKLFVAICFSEVYIILDCAVSCLYFFFVLAFEWTKLCGQH